MEYFFLFSVYEPDGSIGSEYKANTLLRCRSFSLLACLDLRIGVKEPPCHTNTNEKPSFIRDDTIKQKVTKERDGNLRERSNNCISRRTSH